MEKNKGVLSKQKKTIILLALLALILAVAYFLISFFVKEELNTVLLIDEEGDYVEAVVSDSSGRGITLNYLSGVLSGENDNKFNVKKGESRDVLCTFNADGIEITYYPMIFPEIPLNELSRVTVTSPVSSFSVYMTQDSVPLISGAEENLYQSNELSNLLLQARYMLSNRRIDFSGEYSDYGIHEDSVRVDVTDKSGRVNSVLIGDLTPDGSGYYMKHTDKEHIYVMDSSCEVFFNDVTYFLSPIITKTIPEESRNYLSSFTFDKNRLPFFSCAIIPEEQRAGVNANRLHRMTYPSKDYVLNTYNLYEVFSTLGALSGEAVMEYGVSEKEGYEDCMAFYGFDEPYADIRYTFGTQQYMFVVGDSVTDEESGEKYYYVYSPYMDTIVLLAASKVPFLEYEMVDFVQAKVFQHNIADVAEIQVTGKNSTRSFSLSGTGKDLAVTEKNSGKVVDSDSFRQFYISLLNVNLDGYSSFEESRDVSELEHELTFNVTLNSGERLTYSFYSESTLRCYMVVDGKGEFYTKREYIDKILANTDKLMSGEIIESEF